MDANKAKIHFHLWNKVIIFSLWKLLWEEVLSFCCLPDILRAKKWTFLSGWYLTQTKITQHPHSFAQWRFHSSFFEPLVSQGFAIQCVWLNLQIAPVNLHSFSAPVCLCQSWAAITRCQRLGKRVNNRSLLLMVLGAWNSRRGHWAWPPSEESPAACIGHSALPWKFA